MLDNLLLFSTKMKLHDTEAIKFLFLIAHLDEVYFQSTGKEMSISAISDNCKKQTTKVKLKNYLSFYNL